MGEILLRAQDQLKLDILYKIETQKLTRSEGRLLLNVSERTLRRYLERYRKKGLLGIRHGNCLRRPLNKINDDFKRQIQELIKGKYYDFNILHMQEKLKENHNVIVKRETLRKWCHELKLVKREKRRRSKARKIRPRMGQAGLLVQMDGSYHRWFSETPACLMALIDDASNEVHAEFFPYETTPACLKVLKDFIRKKGVFQVLYVDKAGVYGGIKRTHFSQVERALNELGVSIVYAQSPEGKGRVERLFGTLQDRLVAEMRLNKINNINDANRYLQEHYLPHLHNPKFCVQPINTISAYKPLHPGYDLDKIFCIKEFRTVARDHTFSVGAEKYMIADQIRYSIHKQKVEIRFKNNGQFEAYYLEKRLTVLKVKKYKIGA